MELYIYRLDDNSHVATVYGETNAACEYAAQEMYNTDDYAYTYSPAFGFSGGLVEENPDAEQIQA